MFKIRPTQKQGWGGTVRIVSAIASTFAPRFCFHAAPVTFLVSSRGAIRQDNVAGADVSGPARPAPCGGRKYHPIIGFPHWGILI
jgi:hypothetical protein